jgi:hypothetical protein
VTVPLHSGLINVPPDMAGLFGDNQPGGKVNANSIKNNLLVYPSLNVEFHLTLAGL